MVYSELCLKTVNIVGPNSKGKEDHLPLCCSFILLILGEGSF